MKLDGARNHIILLNLKMTLAQLSLTICCIAPTFFGVSGRACAALPPVACGTPRAAWQRGAACVCCRSLRQHLCLISPMRNSSRAARAPAGQLGARPA